MRSPQIARLLVLMPLVALAACSDEQLGSAVPPLPQIDVCVLPSPDAGAEVCYEAIKQARADELCTGTEACLLPVLEADLGRVAPSGTGTLEIRIKNIGGEDLEVYNPKPAPGTSPRYRVTPAPVTGDSAVWQAIQPAGEAILTVQLPGTMCGRHEAHIVLTSNDGKAPSGAPLGFDAGQPDTPIYVNVTGFVGGPCLMAPNTDCKQPPGSVDFGSAPVGQQPIKRFSFESCGDEPVAVLETSIGIDPADVFSVVSTTYTAGEQLVPGSFGHVDLQYSPEAMAPSFGELWLDTNSLLAQPLIVPLNGRGAPRPSCELAALPADSSFGQVSSSATKEIKLVNQGALACNLFEVSPVSGSSDFQVSSGAPPPNVSMAPGDTHDVTLTYSPSNDSPAEAVFRAVADDASSAQDGFQSVVQFRVEGNPSIPDGCVLDILPDLVAFDPVSVGEIRSESVTITNVGSSFCIIEEAILAAGAPDFRIGDLGFLGNILTPSAPLNTANLTVTFEPESEGVKTGILRVESNDVTGSTRDIQIYGSALGARLCIDVTGAAPATLQCSTTQPCATLDFGDVPDDETRTQDVTLTSCGEGVLRVRGLNMDPAGGLAFIKDAPTAAALPLNIGPGQSRMVTIRYRPASPGGDLGGLDILSNATNAEAARLDLRGNYDGGCTTILRCSPSPVEFGSQEVGVSSVRSAVCSNFGSESLTVSNVTVAGDPSFAIVGPTFADLAPSESFTVQVECSPLQPGLKNGTVTIESDACDSTPLDILLSCNAIEVDVPACIGSSVFQPVEKWRWDGTPAYPQYDDVWMTPVVINLTDDNVDGSVDVLDTPDVVFTALKSSMEGLECTVNPTGCSQEEFCHANDAQPAIVVAISGDDGHELWAWGTLPAGDPGDPNALAMESEANMAAADIDADGLPEIIGVKYTHIEPPEDCDMSFSGMQCCIRGKYAYGSLIALEHDGSFKWESERWHMSELVGENAGAISIGDMDGDGLPEVSFGNAVFDHNGLRLFEGETESPSSAGHGEGGAGHGPISVFADLNGDGTNELVAGRTAFLADGSTYYDRTDLKDGLTTIANVDGDPQPEIIMLTGANDLYVLEHDGSTKYGPHRILSGNISDNGQDKGFISTNPAVGDLDGDGFPEIVIAATNNIHVFEHALDPKWSMPISDQTGASGPTTFDFEGDGMAEVVHADEGDVYIWAGTDGTLKYQAPRGSRTITDNPVIADVDNDGHADILLAMESAAGPFGMHGVIAYSNEKNNWIATRRVWNQHAYHITNISESGVVPAIEGSGWLEQNVYRSNVIRCE